jgi:hypothetical protein
MAGNPLNFHIAGRTAAMADVQRNFMFNVMFLNVAGVAPASSIPFGIEDLTVRCTAVKMPDVSIEMIETLFMGTKKFFPGKKNVGGTVSCTFYETEDQQISRFLYEWHQRIFNTNPDAGDGIKAGKSASALRAGLTSDIVVQMFAYNGTPLPYAIKAANCWINAAPAPDLNFSGTEAVTYNASFQCDYWTLVGPFNFTTGYAD